MSAPYLVLRPPLSKTYDLPSRKQLLNLKRGDLVKVVFQVGNEGPEHLWLQLSDTNSIDKWTGVTDNDPLGKQTAQELPAGTIVSFHPLDIINVY